MSDIKTLFVIKVSSTYYSLVTICDADGEHTSPDMAFNEGCLMYQVKDRVLVMDPDIEGFDFTQTTFLKCADIFEFPVDFPSTYRDLIYLFGDMIRAMSVPSYELIDDSQDLVYTTMTTLFTGTASSLSPVVIARARKHISVRDYFEGGPFKIEYTRYMVKQGAMGPICYRPITEKVSMQHCVMQMFCHAILSRHGLDTNDPEAWSKYDVWAYAMAFRAYDVIDEALKCIYDLGLGHSLRPPFQRYPKGVHKPMVIYNKSGNVLRAGPGSLKMNYPPLGGSDFNSVARYTFPGRVHPDAIAIATNLGHPNLAEWITSDETCPPESYQIVELTKKAFNLR